MWLSTDPKMNKQDASGKRKHIIVTIPQKLERIRRLESDKLQCDYCNTRYWIVNCLIQRNRSTNLYGAKRKCEVSSKVVDIATA